VWTVFVYIDLGLGQAEKVYITKKKCFGMNLLRKFVSYFRGANDQRSDDPLEYTVTGESVELKPINADDLRRANHSIPKGSFEAPLAFRLDNASHGGGYHVHLLIGEDESGQPTNIVFTRIGQKVYAYYHNEGKSHVNFRMDDFKTDSMTKRLIRYGLMDVISKKRLWNPNLPQNKEFSQYLFDV